ncbi:MAG: DUF5615 family PIN-like protein [Chloroflexota bacterium]|nr:DUF5615 family PIN-like protein [Chloroflexota bacterium]MDQ6906177.1 DUF5615 family PIN-like protein [Chloroflexota bacterium]
MLLRQFGHDVVHSQELGLKYEPDDAQLFAAAEDDRVLVTKNGDDFALLHRAWQRWSVAWGVHPIHAGILIVAADWPYPDAVQGINDFVQSDNFTPNQLFEWRGQWYVGRAPRSDRR